MRPGGLENFSGSRQSLLACRFAQCAPSTPAPVGPGPPSPWLCSAPYSALPPSAANPAPQTLLLIRSNQPRPADQPGFYGRLGVGVDWPEGNRYRDANCASTEPPALFGCVDGDDGRPLGAPGEFDATPVLDAALLSWRANMDFSGQSNFLGAGANQPVNGSVSSLAGFGVAYVDLPRIGQARNRMGSMTYGFPSLSATATTTTPGGSRTDLAYLLTAGFSVPLGERFDLDLAYRYTDLGQVQTASGQATVVRASGTRSIAIGGTKADLRSHGVMLSLRYAF